MTTEEQAEKMTTSEQAEKLASECAGELYSRPDDAEEAIILDAIPLIELLEVARAANSLPMSGISDEELALLDALAALEAKGIEL